MSTRITFVRQLNEIDCNVFIIENYAINHVDFIDEYGDVIPRRDNGSQFLPENTHEKFIAMTLTEPTGMKYTELIELQYDEFIEIATLARASKWTPQTRNKSEKYL